MTNAVCVSCRRSIDAAARLCPYCGANPVTGERIDTDALLQEVFHPREISTSESVLEYARQRQGVVIAISVIAALLLLGGIHQFVTMRNESSVTNAQAVPLTEVADLADQESEVQPRPLPALTFQHSGRPQAMRTYIMERGAVTPPEIIAAQQAEAAAAAAKQAAAQPQPGTPPAATPRPAAQQPARPAPQPQRR